MEQENKFGQFKATRFTVLIGVVSLVLLIAFGAWEYLQSKLDNQLCG